MYNVSSDFKKSVYAGVRKTYAKLRFEILDITAFTDNTKTVSSEAAISRKSQLTNKIRSMSNKYGVYEKDYLKLDGTFIIPPIPSELLGEEIGWWSSNLSNENGSFSIPPTLEFNFASEHSSAGITIVFDNLNNECAEDFTIQVFDINGIKFNESLIVGNTKSTFVYLASLSDYKKIILTITKWCKGYRRAKIVEVDFGIFKEYTEENLISLDILQELDATSISLPVGTLGFDILNENKEFDIINTEGIYKYLKQGQECFSEFGVELPDKAIEYVPMGKHYLSEWKTVSNNSVARFKAEDIISLLSNTEQENLVARNITLYTLAAEILSIMGISDYYLSPNLNLIYTKALYKKTSLREILHMIAIAGMCVIYSDSLGKLYLKQLISAEDVKGSIIANEASISNKEQVLNNVLDTSYNLASYEKDRVKLDGSFNIPQQDMGIYEVGWWSDVLSNNLGVFIIPPVLEINLTKESSSINLQVMFDNNNNEYATVIDIKGYNSVGVLIINDSKTNTSSDWLYTNNLLSNCMKLQLIIKSWSKPYRRAKVVEIGYDIPISNITHNSMYGEPDIEVLKVVKTVEVMYYSAMDTKLAYTTTNTNIKEGMILKVDNPLINTLLDAQNVANWLLKESSLGAKFTTNWMQNPALNLADRVTIETRLGINNTVSITKQEFSYQGALRGKTEVRGVI